MHSKWFALAVVVASVAACGAEGSSGLVEI